jgi:flagellar motility protein MotE (MotC chaperone)
MPDDDKPEGTVSFADLRAVVKEMVAEVVGSGKDDKPKDDKSKDDYEADNSKTARQSLADEVKAALASIRDSEAEEESKKSMTERLHAVEELLAEKPPVERRRVHKIMGWGD